MRIHELAKELGVSSKELIAALEEMGLEGRTASSSVPDEAVPRLRASGGKAVPGAKPPKGATEEPAPKRKAKPKTKAAAKPKAEPAPEPEPEPVPEVVEVIEPEPEPDPDQDSAFLPVLKLAPGATAQEIADKTSRSPADVIKVLLALGEMVTATMSLNEEAIELVAAELGYRVDWVGVEEDMGEPEAEDDEGEQSPRPPVVTVMGHVDHGKTLLLDTIRTTDVAAGEFGGITQHIGAYQVHLKDKVITFIDTPGHEAFTAMRARGAQITDVAILVVAADDGVMPQTLEALNHAKAAGVPIIVAVNKIDKEGADPTRVRQQLTEHEMIPVEWGGTAEFVDVSAKAGDNLDKLLETVLIVAELEDLKAVPDGRSRGAVIEAHLDKGRGPVATVLVQWGTLEAGDSLISGTTYCRVRALLDENGKPVEHAGPSRPVQVLGWTAVPEAGDDFREVADEREARHLAQERETRARAAELVSSRPVGLADLIAATREAEIAELNVVLKADVQGSLEAVADQFTKLPQEEVRVRVVHRGVGAINESDIQLAMASGAIVIGFNVRPEPKAKELSDREGVDLRLYRVIYEALDDIRAALSGMLTPGETEAELGRAEVRATFKVPKVGMAAGCYITSGTITRGAKARLVRDGVVVYDGKVETLRRFKDDVREVKEGFECGIGLERFQDVKEGDVIEAYEIREVARSL
ncbi:MAG: translation initiation factor IF-2 [Actinomycetota bacterium]